MTAKRVLVSGASSLPGRFLIAELQRNACEISAISRRPLAMPGVSCVRADLAAGPAAAFPAVDTLFHCAPLTLLPALLAQLDQSPPARIVAIGTSSVITKAVSSDGREVALMQEFRVAESRLVEWAQRHGTAWTLLRPTMVYDGHGDRNVARIRRFIRRFRFFPMFSPLAGLRQPVHARDLARACLLAADSPASFNKAYEIGGGEVLDYRRMVERIFAAESSAPRFLRVPRWIATFAIAIAGRAPFFSKVSRAMLERTEMDMVFDNAAARRDFGYSPQDFLP